MSTFDFELASIPAITGTDSESLSMRDGGGAEPEDVVADLLMHEPDEVGVGGGVADRVVAADQQRARADGDVVEQRLGDLLVAADEGGGVAGRPGRLGQRGPQGLFVQVLLPGVAK